VAGRTAPAQRSAAAGPPARSAKGSAVAGKNGTGPRSRRSPAETVALAARIKAEHPTITEAELAAELGISLSRWRTIRREAAQSLDHATAALAAA
jgi:hypothetical protein